MKVIQSQDGRRIVRILPTDNFWAEVAGVSGKIGAGVILINGNNFAEYSTKAAYEMTMTKLFIFMASERIDFQFPE